MILFTIEEIIELAKAYKKIHKSDDMDDYDHGIVQGIDYVLYLCEALE